MVNINRKELSLGSGYKLATKYPGEDWYPSWSHKPVFVCSIHTARTSIKTKQRSQLCYGEYTFSPSLYIINKVYKKVNVMRKDKEARAEYFRQRR